MSAKKFGTYSVVFGCTEEEISTEFNFKSTPVERNVQIMKQLVRRSVPLRRAKNRPLADNKTQFCTF
jgi:hypothetical protein